MPAPQIGQQLGKEVRNPVAIPEMVMRVDDGEAGLDDLFVPEREPIGSDDELAMCQPLGGVVHEPLRVHACGRVLCLRGRRAHRAR